MNKDPQHRYAKHKRGTKTMSHLLFEDDACVEIRILDEYVSKSICQEREKYYINKYVCVNARGRGRDVEKNKAQRKQYREQNKVKVAEGKKKYKEQNKVRIAEKNKIRYEKNKVKINEKGKKYREENKDKIAEKRNEKIECNTCGSIVRRSGISQHKKTKKGLQTLSKNLF